MMAIGMIPDHVAIIMDGNRRHGEEHFHDQTKGHEMGASTVETIVRSCLSLKVSYLTLFAFSTENWNRSKFEINVLMDLFRRFFVLKGPELINAGVRVRFIGRRNRLRPDILGMVYSLEERSKHNTELTVTIALDYGGRDEIVRAARKLIGRVLTFRQNIFTIDEAAFALCLDTSGVPDPDLLIRTGGEQRLSGFLLWQTSYSEMYFTDEKWPAFSARSFEQALEWFAKRTRRFGGDAPALKVAAE